VQEGEGMGTVAVVKFYEDEVRSYHKAEGRTFVILRDPFLNLGLNPNQQIAQLKRNPLYEGFLETYGVIVQQNN
jgi:hypothetical protein